jgi:transglutaminase 1
LVLGETLRINVTAKEYLDKLVDKNLIKLYAIANVKETGQTWSEEDDFQLQTPKLKVQVLQTRWPRNSSGSVLFTRCR